MWAVGTAIVYRRVTLVEHWDGSRWRVVPSPNLSPGNNELDGVAALGPRDVWAVGVADGSGDHLNQTLIEHWDGAHWRIVPSPATADCAFVSLAGVAAASPHDVWAVGAAGSSNNGPFRALIERWDGVSWRAVAAPTPGVSGSMLHAVAVASARDIWAVGGTYVAAGSADTSARIVAEHWDGARWRVVP